MRKRTGLVVVGLVGLLVVTPFFPVQLSYVYSDSMEPTIQQYDGYVLVPAGDVQVGDIVTFWAPGRDSYATHRIVGRSERGYITQGDGNAQTDQAGGASYVQRDEIRGQVLTVQGEPVLLPGLGRAARSVASYRLEIAALLVATLLVGALWGRSSPGPSRSVPEVGEIIWPVFVIALVSAIALQFVGAPTQRLTYVATDRSSSAPNTLTVGEPGTETLTLNRSSGPATVSMVHATGATVTDRTRNRSGLTVSLRIPPPEERGAVATSVTVYRYVRVLPVGVIDRLHRIHPLLAITATTGTIMLPMGLLLFLGIDGKEPLRPSNPRIVRSLKRRVREL